MEKIIARQVPPEYQESPFYRFLGELNGIILAGNNRLVGYNAKELALLTAHLFDLAAILADETAADFRAALAEHAPYQYREYTPDEIATTWPALLERIEDGPDYQELAEALSLITGHVWDTREIRGCSQGDWQQIWYNTTFWPDSAVAALETEYFNTGTEYTLEPDTEGFYSIYCHGWTDEQHRAEIAENIGCSPDEIRLLKFTGYTQIPKYEEV